MTSISQLTRILSSATASLAFVFVYPAADLTGISLQFTNTKQTLRFVAFLEVLSTIQSHPTCTNTNYVGLYMVLCVPDIF